jgi:hypothetical protein
MPQAGFEPAIPAMERTQMYFLERTAAGIGKLKNVRPVFILLRFRLASLFAKRWFLTLPNSTPLVAQILHSLGAVLIESIFRK